MTVCVGAVCEGGDNIVVAADRMFTFNAPVSLEFETGEKKIDAISTTCVVLTAGVSPPAKEMIVATLKALGGAQRPAIDVVAETVKTSYIQIRANKLREGLIIPWLGPDYLKHESMNVSVPVYLEKQPGIYQNLAVQSTQFNLQVEFLVAGIDDEGGRIAFIGHPGTIAWLDTLGYGAIGSGAIHATMRLALAGLSRATNLKSALYRVYEAKRAAEVAPGVGPTTDMAIVHRDRVAYVSQPTLDNLKAILDDARGNLQPDLARIKNAPELQL
jgi:hypothetical protein